MKQGAMTIKQFCAWAGIGLSKFYDEVNAGRLPMRKLGRKSIVRMIDAEVWLADLPEGKGPSPQSRQAEQSPKQAMLPSEPIGSRW